MVRDEVIATWACSNEAGGSTDRELPPGVYRLVADEIKVIFGPLDADFFYHRPAVTVALIDRAPGEGLALVDYKGDGHPAAVNDVEPTERLVPLALDPTAGFVVGKAGLYRLSWAGKGDISLVKVG